MSEQRQHTRHRVSWRVAVILADQPSPLPAKVQEISAGGAGILMQASLPTKTRCKLIFEIPKTDYRSFSYVEVVATVVYTALVGGSSEFRTGFQFSQVNETIRNIIEK